MDRNTFEQTWHNLSAEIMTGIHEWRLQHPTATLRDIETEVDARLNRMRAQLLQDLALHSAAADWQQRLPDLHPLCPQCATPLDPRGSDTRRLQTHGGRDLVLERSYGVCPACGTGFFPLDEQLGLLPGSLSPRLSEALVRLSPWIPSFEQAARELAFFTGATVSKSTAVRRTQAAGAAALAVHQAEVEVLLREAPPAPAHPEALVLSLDGAMVPLVHGEWTEVKTLAIGTPTSVSAPDGTGSVRTSNLSYFSRATNSDTFAHLALGEIQRRGVETAGRVAAVSDGAEWIQGFVDLHAPTAVRILDFPHAAGYIAAIGGTLDEGQRLLSEEAVGQYLHRLKHKGPSAVLAELGSLAEAHPSVVKQLAYLEKREVQLQYPVFEAEGWPLGSGMVESANKLVVEARLKGAGMHWAPEHVDPMVALRNAVCTDRWDEVWGQIEGELKRQVVTRRGERQKGAGAAQQGGQSGPEQKAAREGSAVSLSPEVIAQVRAEMQQPPEVHPWRRAWSRRQQAVQAAAAQ